MRAACWLQRDFNPRAPCGARHKFQGSPFSSSSISIHAPLAGRDMRAALYIRVSSEISIHAPLAGRDCRFYCPWFIGCLYFNPRAPCGARLNRFSLLMMIFNYFNPRAPCGARHSRCPLDGYCFSISIHAPLAGRDDLNNLLSFVPLGISIHAPLAGRDLKWNIWPRLQYEYFNPRAPCGARHGRHTGFD